MAGVACPVVGAHHPVAGVTLWLEWLALWLGHITLWLEWAHTVVGVAWPVAGVAHTVVGVACPVAGAHYPVTGGVNPTGAHFSVIVVIPVGGVRHSG